MRTRTLGRTGLEVSELGFGAAPLGDEFGRLDPAEIDALVGAAIDSGITFFDTAAYYGRGLSEQRLGAALGERRKEIVLSTKCCRFDRRGFDFSGERVHADVRASLERLGTDVIDLYSVHDVEFGLREVVLNETLPALLEVQRQGLVRHIGLTGLPVQLLAELASEGAGFECVLSYCHHSLLLRDLEPVLGPVVGERELGLINGSPLHMGLLTGRQPPEWHPAPMEVRAAAERMHDICVRAGESLPEVALAWALSTGPAQTTLSGIGTQAELAANLKAVGRGVDPELVEELSGCLDDALGRTWHEGLPENAPPNL